jgi:hemoglobin
MRVEREGVHPGPAKQPAQGGVQSPRTRYPQVTREIGSRPHRHRSQASFRMTQSLFQLAGGEEPLRAVIEDFYDHVFDDVMIGFFFLGSEKSELVRLELEFVMRFLGADQKYTGRSIKLAHSGHHIMGGQFNRRTQLLRQAMERQGLHEDVRRAWIEHTESLREQVTRDAHGECKPPA